MVILANEPWKQGSWGKHGPSGPTGLRWVPCWPHELCYLGYNYAVQGNGFNLLCRMIWLSDPVIIFCSVRFICRHFGSLYLFDLSEFFGSPTAGPGNYLFTYNLCPFGLLPSRALCYHAGLCTKVRATIFQICNIIHHLCTLSANLAQSFHPLLTPKYMETHACVHSTITTDFQVLTHIWSVV